MGIEDVKLIKRRDYAGMIISRYQYKDFTIEVTDQQDGNPRIDAYDQWKEITMSTTYPDRKILMKVDFISSDPKRIKTFTEKYHAAIEVYQLLNEHREIFIE